MRCATAFLTVLLVVSTCSFAWAAEDEDGGEQVVKLDDVIAALHDNHAAADELYMDKRLQVQGYAGQIERFRTEKDAEVQYVLRLHDENPRQPGLGGGAHPAVHFVFDIKQRRGLAEIKRGDMVVIEATCAKDDNVGQAKTYRFQDAKLIRIFPTPSPGTFDERRPGAPAAPSTVPTYTPAISPAPAFPPMAAPPAPFR